MQLNEAGGWRIDSVAQISPAQVECSNLRPPKRIYSLSPGSTELDAIHNNQMLPSHALPEKSCNLWHIVVPAKRERQ